MEDDLKALLREGLDLYKRELDLVEANHKRHLALLQSNTLWNRGWRFWLRWVLLAIIIAFTMSVVIPATEWVIHRAPPVTDTND